MDRTDLETREQVAADVAVAPPDTRIDGHHLGPTAAEPLESLDEHDGPCRFGDGDDPAALLAQWADRWPGNPRTSERAEGPAEGQNGPTEGPDADAYRAAFDDGETSRHFLAARAVFGSGRTGFVDHVVTDGDTVRVNRTSGELEAYQELPADADFPTTYVRVAEGDTSTQVPWSQVVRIGASSVEPDVAPGHDAHDRPGQPVEAFGGPSPLNDLVTDAVIAARRGAEVQSRLEGRHPGDGGLQTPTPDEYRSSFDGGETFTGHTWHVGEAVGAIAGTGRQVVLDHVVSDGETIGVRREQGELIRLDRPADDDFGNDYLVVGNGEDETRVPVTNFVRMGVASDAPDTPEEA